MRLGDKATFSAESDAAGCDAHTNAPNRHKPQRAEIANFFIVSSPFQFSKIVCAYSLHDYNMLFECRKQWILGEL